MFRIRIQKKIHRKLRLLPQNETKCRKLGGIRKEASEEEPEIATLRNAGIGY